MLDEAPVSGDRTKLASDTGVRGDGHHAPLSLGLSVQLIELKEQLLVVLLIAEVAPRHQLDVVVNQCVWHDCERFPVDHRREWEISKERSST